MKKDPIAHMDRYLPWSAIEALRGRSAPRLGAEREPAGGPARYTVEHRGGCTVYWLGERARGEGKPSPCGRAQAVLAS